jgi:integrase/recombinase XerD
LNDREALDDYLRWIVVERGRRPATVQAYRRDLERLLGWLDGRGLTLASLDGTSVEQYLVSLRASGLAPSSVSRALASLRGLFAHLVDEGQLVFDPTSRVAAPRRPRSLPKALEERDVAALIEAPAEDSPLERRDRALAELLYGTGARVSEAVGIELQHLDFDEELILVTGKGDKQRLVPMGRELRDSLRAYLNPGGRASLVTDKSRSRLFLNARGGPLSRQGVDLILRQRALRAGIDSTKVSAHVLRHSCATHMLAHGADIRSVQELLGHVSIATTQIYTGVSLTSLRTAYAEAHPRAHG